MINVGPKNTKMHIFNHQNPQKMKSSEQQTPRPASNVRKALEVCDLPQKPKPPVKIIKIANQAENAQFEEFINIDVNMPSRVQRAVGQFERSPRMTYE